MGRKRDEVIWDEFEQTNDGITQCKHCRVEFRGKPSATRLRNHLLGVEGCGIRCCTLVPKHVKNALVDASTSSKRPRIEPPSSINNNEFNNQGDDRQPMQEELQRIEEWFERSDTSALERWDNASVLRDIMAEIDVCRIGPGPSIDEVNNIASTSAPQQNNEFQNGMQADQEVVQGANQERFEIVPEILNEVIQVLIRKVEWLSSRAEDINTTLESLEIRSEKKRKREVENWLTNVQKMKNDLEQIKKEVQESSSLMPGSLRRRVENNIQEADELIDQGRFPEGLVLMEVNQSKGEELVTVPLVGCTSTMEKLDKIWGCLMNEETLSIGVYGMGGVRKTTVVTHIHNWLLKDDSSFDNVYWVTVSQKSSIYQLQNDIANTVGLDLSMEKDEKKRAAKLFHRLQRSKKFVLILDDMWEKFPAETVGVPLRVNGGKLLLTTRSLKVCREMECRKVVKVEPLSMEESWDLFLKIIGPNNALAPHIEGVAKSIAKECAGLPLAIVVVAGSMRGVEDINDWINALYELKGPRKGLNHDMENDVFKPLKFSYDCLDDEILQQCFLYCSLFPKDYMIKREELIKYWIREGLIDEMESRVAEIDRGNTMINQLLSACLLESKAAYVKMHDVIRDMALTVARVNPIFMVKAGVQLRELPSEKEWLCNLDRVSLMHNSLKVCSADFSPNCPKLKTLLLQGECSYHAFGTYHLRDLPNCFFVHMESLTILNLSYSAIEWLPDSARNLGKLRALLLRGCSKLKHITSLGKLENLQELDLHQSRVCELLNDIERLVNLRVLDLSYTPIQGLVPSAVLQKLSQLQTLKLEYSYTEVEPEALVSLTKLDNLGVNFFEIHKLHSYVRTQHRQRLSGCIISLRLYY